MRNLFVHIIHFELLSQAPVKLLIYNLTKPTFALSFKIALALPFSDLIVTEHYPLSNLVMQDLNDLISK